MTPAEQIVLIHAGRRLLQIVGMVEKGWSVEISHHADHSGPRVQWLRDGAPKVYSVYFRKIDYAGNRELLIAKGRDADLDKAIVEAIEETKKLEGAA